MKNPDTEKAMSNHPITVRFDEDIQSARNKMRNAYIRHLPVLDGEGKVIGLLSNEDVERVLTFQTADRTRPIVSNYMTWPVPTVTADTEILQVTRLMVSEKASAVLVTQDDELIGIITYTDLLKILERFLGAGTLKDKITDWTYNSPVGDVINFLAEVGL